MRREPITSVRETRRASERRPVRRPAGPDPAWLVLLVIAALWLTTCRGEEPLRFAVTFESAGGLEVGMPVVHRGLEVGRVTAVGLDDQGLVEIEVEIESEYRSAVAHNSIIRSQTHGLRRKLRLAVEDGPGERRPVADGDVLSGSPRLLDDALTKLQEGARRTWDKTAESARQLQEALAEAGQKELERLRREQIPELRKQAEQARRELEDAGMSEEAADYWQRFEGWLEQLERSDEPPSEPPPAPQPPS